jgi:hypothetical protein
MVAPGYCHLVFVSGLGVGFSTLLGGDLEVFFCFLLGESKCGVGLVVVVGARFVRLIYSSLLAIGDPGRRRCGRWKIMSSPPGSDWGGDAFVPLRWVEAPGRRFCWQWWMLLLGGQLWI